MPSFTASDQPWTLAILGGAGPQVATRLQLAVLDAHQARTGAWRDEDFPAIVGLTRAVDGVDETGVADPLRARRALASLARDARAAGATHAVVACASLHTCLPQGSPVAILDWLGEGARQARALGWRRVGVIGSRSSWRSGLVAAALSAAGLEPRVLTAAEQGLADALIAGLMAGRRDSEMQARAMALADTLAGCDGLWWACTEFSLMPAGWRRDPHLDSLRVIVDTALASWADARREEAVA